MNILSISPFNYGNNCNIKKSNPSFGSGYIFREGLNTTYPRQDLFVKPNNAPKYIKNSHFYTPLQIKKTPTESKFSLEDYKKLSKSEKEFLIGNVPSGVKGLAGVNVGIAIAFKKTFDDKYGEGNYKFISLGTSPACVAKAMELMGEDVAYLPMSYAHTTCTKHWLEESPYIDFYKSYMDKIGLTNENLKKEGKTGIICDYTVSGRSLKLSEFMLKGPLGLDENLLDTYTMNSLIKESEYIPEEIKDKYLNELLRKEKAADFCDVPHFSFIDKKPFNSGKIRDSKSLIKFFESYHSRYSNSYNLCVMKFLEDEGKLKELKS